jgi:hypothetical protein
MRIFLDRATTGFIVTVRDFIAVLFVQVSAHRQLFRRFIGSDATRLLEYTAKSTQNQKADPDLIGAGFFTLQQHKLNNGNHDLRSLHLRQSARICA